jgi:GDP-L-fucose synthase
MRILVLGSKGFIGNALMSATVNQDLNLIGLSRDECDFTNQKDLTSHIRTMKPDVVINAAGMVAGVVGNLRRPVELLTRNAQLNVSIALSCLESDVQTYIYLGAACMYPSGLDAPMHPSILWSARPEKTSFSYATAKLMGVTLNESVNEEFGRKWITIIPSNLFGNTRSEIGDEGHVMDALITRFRKAKDSDLKEVVVWGDGTPRRTFLHVEDFVSAILFSIQNLSTLSSVINVNGDAEISIMDLAHKIKSYVDFNGAITFDSQKPNGAPRKNLDDSEIRNLGWRPKKNFDEALINLCVS